MKKRILALIVTFLLIMISSSVYAVAEPTGFLGMKFGDDFETCRDIKMCKKDHVPSSLIPHTYALSTKESIKNIKIMDATYFFYEDEMYYVSVLFEEVGAYKTLKSALVKKYGNYITEDVMSFYMSDTEIDFNKKVKVGVAHIWNIGDVRIILESGAKLEYFFMPTKRIVDSLGFVDDI